MNRQQLLITTALLSVLGAPAFAQKPAVTGAAVAASAPGTATVGTTVKVTATVEAIDAATRQITIKGPQGKSNVVTAGADVRNFDQIKVGDQVVLQYAEALTLTLKKGGKELPAATASADGARAAAGQKPGGVMARQVEVTADVIALDAKTQTVTLRGPKQVVDLKVPDAGQFKLIKVGDQIQATYTEAVALSVEPVAKK
jgi:hypothetical protein